MDYYSPSLQRLQATVREIVEQVVAPRSRMVDSDAAWPEHSMRALAEAGLLGLCVPQELGGHGQGLPAVALLTEIIGKACPSSALCFGMHCVGSAVIAAKATVHQREKYLRSIAAGRHVTTLALSERGSGTHFYIPGLTLVEDGEFFALEGDKQFITSGGHADSYVISTVSAQSGTEQAGDFSCLVVDARTEGLEWQAPWRGFGMRGNASRGVHFRRARVPRENLLGSVGDQAWYVFEVVAPFFLTAMAGTYVGIAAAAVEETAAHLKGRRYAHSGEALAEIESIQSRFAQMWMACEKSRALVREASLRGDSGHPEALHYILASKADAGTTAVELANEAMTLCGGMAYGENSRVAQLLRDARASHVMAPTTDLLKVWLGRALLELPLL